MNEERQKFKKRTEKESAKNKKQLDLFYYLKNYDRCDNRAHRFW